MLCILAIVLFFALGVWSVLKLGIRRSFLYRHVDDRLLTSGPYALVRHPQFLSSLGIALFGVLLCGRPETWGGIAGFTTLLMNSAMFTLSLWVLSIIAERPSRGLAAPWFWRRGRAMGYHRRRQAAA